MEKHWIVTPDDDGIRPAGPPDACCYCQQKVGQEHKYDCVIRKKVVTVQVVLEFPVAVPEHWTNHDVVFWLEDSSSCFDNRLQDIMMPDDEDGSEENSKGCSCKYLKASAVLKDGTE